MKFRQETTSHETKWTRFYGRDGAGKSYKLDIQCRPLFPHLAREIQRPFLERRGTGANVTENVPEERTDAYGMAIADHLIAALGNPNDAEHPHGLEADFTENGLLVGAPDAAEYGVPTLTPGIDAGLTTEKPWPMSPEGKFALLNMLPGLQQHISDFAREIASPIASPERQEEDDANLEDTPSSEPSSPSVTAGEEE